MIPCSKKYLSFSANSWDYQVCSSGIKRPCAPGGQTRPGRFTELPGQLMSQQLDFQQGNPSTHTAVHICGLASMAPGYIPRDRPVSGAVSRRPVTENLGTLSSEFAVDVLDVIRRVPPFDRSVETILLLTSGKSA